MGSAARPLLPTMVAPGSRSGRLPAANRPSACRRRTGRWIDFLTCDIPTGECTVSGHDTVTFGEFQLPVGEHIGD
jgi:hypothetical protein